MKLFVKKMGRAEIDSEPSPFNIIFKTTFKNKKVAKRQVLNIRSLKYKYIYITNITS